MPSLTTSSCSSFSLLFRTLAIASWWGVALVVNGQSCFSNIQTLNEAVAARTDFTSVETYRLCPNTEFDLWTEAQPVVLRRNMKVICGDDGASSDRYISTL
jgi:hypothetical protein